MDLTLTILLAVVLAIAILIIYLLFNRQDKKDEKMATTMMTPAPQKKAVKTEKQGQALRFTENPGTVTLDATAILGEIDYIEDMGSELPTTADRLDEKIKNDLSEKVGALPPLPAASLRLMNLLRNPESNIKEIASLVSTHPVFSAKMLQAVNSAYFSLPEKITSVGRAITLLGYNNVRSLVIQEDLGRIIRGLQGLDMEAYLKIWVHSAVVSVCAGSFGKRLFNFSEYDLATIGLLHDIGKYFFIASGNDVMVDSETPALIREERHFGANHAVVGGFMARKWQLPEIIAKEIELHHGPTFFAPDTIPPEYLKQSFVLCLADLVAKALGYGGHDSRILPIRDEYYEMFGLSKDLQGLLTSELMKEVEKAHQTVESFMGTG